MATVYAPVDGYTGIVGRVRFLDGVGATDDPKALRYFQRAGYTITPDQHPTAPAPAADAQTGELIEHTPDTAETSDDAAATSTPPADPTEASEQPEHVPATISRPRASASKAEWFEYLNAIDASHGLDLDVTRADIIAAATAAEPA